MLTGLAYAAFTWGYPRGGWRSLLGELVNQPARLLVMLLILAGFIFFADREWPWFRWLGGLVHGAAHLALALAIAAWTATLFSGAAPIPGVAPAVEATWIQIGRLLANFLAGAILGPIVWGIYLLIAVDVFGAQATEAFSALRIQDYKHFLRLHIQPHGILEIYPLGIPRVPREHQAHVRYMLIERPVRIVPS